MKRLPSLSYLERHICDAGAILDSFELELEQALDAPVADHRGQAYVNRLIRRRLKRIQEFRKALWPEQTAA